LSDDQFPRGADDDVDPQALAAVQRALGGLDFLRPEPREDASGGAEEPMPEWVWDRVSSALAAEHDRDDTHAQPRRSRLARWGGGLVAASVAVLAVGVAVTAVRGTAGTVVVTEAPAADAEVAMMAEPADEADVGAAAPPDTMMAGAGASARALAGPRNLSFAGIPPIRKILGSSTDYVPAAMEGQVTAALEDAGIMPTASMPDPMPTVEVPADMPAEMMDRSILKSADALRDCITRLTHTQQSTALLVDQSRFQGEDASIVVAPDYDVSTPTSPDLTMIEVFVVDPDCELTWSMSFRMAR
jgi:hypothetical protein